MHSSRQNNVGLWILGAINNFFYVVLGSASQSLCINFDRTKFIGLILYTNILSGFCGRITNTFFLEGTSYKVRCFFNGLSNILGCCIVAYSVYLGNFWVCICGVVFIGFASSFGESFALGYLKKFSPDIVNSWSSGTGFAGIWGSAAYVAYDALGFSDIQCFLSIIPLVFVYWFMFYRVIRPPTSNLTDRKLLPPEPSENLNDTINTPSSKISITTSLLGARQKSRKNSIEECLSSETTSQRFWRVLFHGGFLIFNLAIVYYSEYVASLGGANRAENTNSHIDDNWFIRHAFVILSFCYQTGVFISRSSLMYVKIKRVDIISIFQFINMIFWVFQGRYKFIVGPIGIWIQFTLMIWCGLLGGASYVNIFYLILHDNTLLKRDRELLVNLAAIGISFGISSAALTILILDYSFWNGS